MKKILPSIPYISGAFSFLLGFLVLLGWHTHHVALIQVLPQLVPIQYNTALGFLISGCGLLATAKQYRFVAMVCGVLVVLIGGLTLIQYTVGLDFDIDQLLMKHYITTQTSHPGRMAPNSALCFLLTGITLLLPYLPLLNNPKNIIVISEFLGLMILALAILALIGYVQGVAQAYGWGELTHMAIHKAVGFITLAAGIICYAWQRRVRNANATSLSLSFGILFFGFLVTFFVWHTITHQKEQMLRQSVQTEAILIRNKLVDHIEARVDSIYRMAARWEASGGTPRTLWEKDVELHMQQPGYRAMEWIDSSYRVRWIVPLKGNEARQDIDLTFELKRAFFLEKTKNNREFLYSGLIDIVEDKRGMSVFFPLYVEQQFDGFIVAVFDIPDFINAVLTHELTSDYELKIFDGDQEIYARNDTKVGIQKWEEYIDVKFQDLKWNLRISPLFGLAQSQRLLNWIVISFGVLLSLLLLIISYFVKLSIHRLRFVVENENRLSAIVDNTVDGLITIDKKGTIQNYNKACEKIFGYKADEVIGENIKILMPEPYHSEHDGYLQNYHRTQKKKIIGVGREVKGKKKNGTIFPLDLSVSEVDIQGRKLYSGIVRDITERKTAEEEIMRSNEELGHFAYVASHDLQEPLRMVTNFTGLLEKRYTSVLDDTGREYIEYAYNGARRMQDLVNDLLEYSRIGQDAESLKNVNINDLVELLKENLKESIDESGAVITYDELPSVYMNPIRLLRVLQNLVGNSIKYQHSETKPEIHISAEKEGDKFIILVRDNGIGIRPEYCEKIFSPFKRLHGKGEYSGTGIGLSISRKIIESYGGKIWAKSELGEGSSFYFTLPIYNKDELAKGEYAI